MRFLMRFIAMCTLVIFTCTTTGCATSNHGAATTSRHATQSKTQPSNVGKDEGVVVDESSGSNSSQVAVLVIAGVAVASVALLFVLANLAAKGIGQGLAGNVAGH